MSQAAGARRPKLKRAVVGRPMSLEDVAALVEWPGERLERALDELADRGLAFGAGGALRLTHDPQAFLAVERRLTLDNLADPDPPEWLHVLFGTHPTTVERIGYALRFERRGG